MISQILIVFTTIGWLAALILLWLFMEANSQRDAALADAHKATEIAEVCSNQYRDFVHYVEIDVMPKIRGTTK